MTTNKTENLLTAIWSRHAGQAAFWRALCLIQLALSGLALLLCARLLNRPREVVRIGCDGIPQLVRLDVEQYTEPNEREMQAFVRLWTVAYARLDSFSAVNDAVFAARYMIPELREAYRRRMRGSDSEPGRLAEIEALRRRTEIDPNDLEVKIDTGVYPWSVTVRGVRKIVGAAEAQRFGLEIQLVRAAREQVLEGMLVQGVRDLPVVDGDAAAGGAR